VREAIRWHPTRQPLRAPLEEALLDTADRASRPEEVVDMVLRAGQRRLTTAPRILAAVSGRRRSRWRGLLVDLCSELTEGVQSPLERRYRQRVERAHGLPVGERNLAEPVPGLGTWYRDVRYREWRVVVELDGRGAHPVELSFRDRRRDNWAARRQESALRYGWREVESTACEVAGEVAAVLTAGGWTGQVRSCGPGCTAERAFAESSFPMSGRSSSA
jgi:hypothetical protein